MTGCAAGPPTPADITAATEMERGRGHDEESLEAWRQVAQSRCPARRAAQVKIAHLDRASDETLRKDDCGIAVLRAGQILERLGRAGEAAEMYESAEGAGAGDRNAARALVEAARLRDEAGDTERALADAEHAVVTYPGESGADDALDRWVRIERRRAARPEELKPLRDRLDGMAQELVATDVADNLLFAAADITDKELHDHGAAIARWAELARRWPRSGLRDDGLWRSAALMRAAGNAVGALEKLDAILTTRRSAWITGSYNSIWLDDAKLLYGQILLDDLHRPRDAARHLLELADDYPESVLRDDALFDLHRAHLALGDTAAACAALTRLARELPDGNRVRAAQARLGELGCEKRP